MGLRRKDMLGKGMWFIQFDGYCRSRVGEQWRSRDSEPTQLLQELDKKEGALGAYFEEWQKVGRSIKLVKNIEVKFENLKVKEGKND